MRMRDTARTVRRRTGQAEHRIRGVMFAQNAAASLEK